MGYHFTTFPMRYKSYTGKMFDLRMGSNGEPAHVVVKVFATKRPKAEVQVLSGHFSESSGVSSSSGPKVSVTDPETVLLCRAALTDDTALVPLIDKLMEVPPEGCRMPRFLSMLTRWWVLAQQENPTAFIEAERRQRAYDNKRFSVGEKVTWHSRHDGTHTKEGVVDGEQFDWHPYLGGGWRFSIPGINAPQEQFRKVEEVVPV